MTLLDVFIWLNDARISAVIRDSLWLFPAIQIFHLLALSVLGGAVLLVDLRLLGLGLSRVPVPVLARGVAPWMTTSLVVITVSGIAMFMSEALRCYDNAAFWVKMATFAVAILFNYGVRARWTSTDLPVLTPGARAIAITSILLWTGVAAAGRGISFW